MDMQLITILIAAAVVVAGTFVIRSVFGSVIKILGLAAVAFLARRQDLGVEGFGWLSSTDLTVIVAAALFGWVVGVIMNLFVFREDGFGRHFFVPLIAVAMSYGAALLIEL